ncbi:hypothetical protein NDA10_000757 [Ustilago hordei]|nr:hypothetical protein NDA10_000757 [Ustilago hordei]
MVFDVAIIAMQRTTSPGATDHVTNDKSNLIISSPCTGFVKTISRTKSHIVAVGQAMLNVDGHEVLLDNILYVPDSNANLILVKALTNNGACVLFDSKYVTFELLANKMVISKLNLQTRHYEIPQSQHEALVISPNEGLTNLPECLDNEAKMSRCEFTLDFMHEQCDHLGQNKTWLIEKIDKVKLMDGKCQDCVVSKLTKAQMGHGSSTHAKDLLELVHVNLAMHWSMKTEAMCLLVTIDDASSFTYVKPLQAKSDALQVLKEWITYAEVQMGHKLKTLCSDNGGEWVLVAAIHWQNETGFCWQKTLPYTSEQNGRAEHAIRTIREMMITMMHTHCLPQMFWPFAAEATAFTKNLLLNIKNQILYHIFYQKDPQKPFDILWTFGCLAWVNIPWAKHKKLDEPANPAIFVRYDKEHKGWKFLTPNHNLLIFWSNLAHFLQDRSWNDHTNTTQIQDMDALHYNTGADIEDFSYDNIDMHDEDLQQPLNKVYHLAPEQDMAFKGEISPPNWPMMPSDTQILLGWQIPPASIWMMSQMRNLGQLHCPCHQTRHLMFAATCKVYPWLHPTTLAELLCIHPRVFPPAAEIHQFQEKLWCNSKLADIGPIPEYNANVYTLTVTNLKPSVKEALTGPDQIHWHETIKAEMDGLESMHIWETVDQPKNMNLVDLKLVLQVKTDANGIPYKFKARFCACGFSQKEGIDFDEIFAPVVTRDAIQTILTIAAKLDWEMDSIDVTQAYLNANLHHNVYLKLPEGAEVPVGKVYKLLKSLYGLKQSSQEWHKELNTHLHSLGFFPLLNIPCVYLKGVGASQVIIAIYVDDMLIVSPQQNQINKMKKAIIDKWKITNNGPATEFLKIKIMQD